MRNRLLYGWLHALSQSELNELAAALASGRVPSDAGSALLRQLGVLFDDPRSSEAVIAHFESMVGEAIFLPFGDG